MFLRQQHELLVPGQAIDPNIYRTTVLSSGAALALVAWDAVLTLDDEVTYIWSGPGRAHVKWIYLFSRWFGLLNQIGIQIWQCFIAAYSPVPLSTCEAFFILESVTFQLLQLCLDAILILRICAVYQRRRPHIAAAFAVVFFEIVISILTQTISVPKSIVDDTCIILHTPAESTCLWIGMIFSQSVLLALTYRGKALLQPAARRSKLITIVVRDGMLVFSVGVGIMSISLLYFSFNQVVINIFLPWMPVVPSILTSRMILNMQMAAEPTESVLEFTTDLGVMTSNGAQSLNPHEGAVIDELQSRDSS